MKRLILLFSLVLAINYCFAQTNTFPASGNVGIGTASPSKKLDIKGNGINLEKTTHDNVSGIIYKDGTPFISNFNYGDNGTVITKGSNVFVGVNAGNFTMGSTATSTSQSSYNTILGTSSFRHNTTGYHNTASGYAVLNLNTTGNNNTGVGYEVLYHNTTGNNNAATGYTALYSNIKGNYNTAFGYASLYKDTSGSYNAAVGTQSLYHNLKGSNNVAVGYQAGMFIADGSTGNSGSGTSVFIGTKTKSLAATNSNQIVIGYNAVGAGSNSVVLGNTSITKTLLQGNVGIGTSTPQSKLAVNGTVTAKQVKVTQTGWPDYVFDDAYQLPNLSETEAFIKKNHRLPGMPPAKEVETNGLDLGEMQKKQMQKIEEMTLYLIRQDELIKKQAKAIDILNEKVARLESKINNE